MTYVSAQALTADRAASSHGLALVSEHDLAEPLHRALRRRSLAHLGGRCAQTCKDLSRFLGEACNLSCFTRSNSCEATA